MTEAEWLACGGPAAMLEFLRGKASDRKLRLFAVACCRRLWRLLTDERSRSLVGVSEEYAEGQATWDDCEDASSAHDSEPWLDSADLDKLNAQNAARATGWFDSSLAASDASFHAAWATVEETALIDPSAYSAAYKIPEHPVQATFVRCIFGNPFRPSTIASYWLPRTVRCLAQAAYDNRILPAGTLDTARLAVLADALEDAGCQDRDILGHLRNPGPHVRGCWVLDCVLGRE